MRGLILSDESFFFLFEWQVDHLGFGLACLLSSLLTTMLSPLSASLASAATAPLMLTAWASHSLQRSGLNVRVPHHLMDLTTLVECMWPLFQEPECGSSAANPIFSSVAPLA